MTTAHDTPPATPPDAADEPIYRSKTLAAWLAVLLGAFGLHRFYLHGLRDLPGWLFPLPTGLGLLGLHRLDTLGQDDTLVWWLLPLLGLSVSVAMFTGILYALTPDEKWDARHNPALSGRATGWGPVLAAIAGLLVGGGVLMATITVSIQKFFEWELQQRPLTLAPIRSMTVPPAAAAQAATPDFSPPPSAPGSRG
jgi:hypothetical protein